MPLGFRPQLKNDLRRSVDGDPARGAMCCIDARAFVG